MTMRIVYTESPRLGRGYNIQGVTRRTPPIHVSSAEKNIARLTKVRGVQIKDFIEA